MIQTTSQVLYDGERNLVMQFSGVAVDSGAEQETNVVKVDVSALTPPARFVKIKKFKYEVVGGILRLLWDADDPILIDALASQGERDYGKIGGMVNPAGLNASGDIVFSTIGFDFGSSYSIEIEMIKKFVS